jgi:hypothetical protein
MEFAYYIWEKSESFGLTVFLAIISVLLTFYVHHLDSENPSSHDLLAGTLSPLGHWFSTTIWYLTLVSFIVYVFRRVLR